MVRTGLATGQRPPGMHDFVRARKHPSNLYWGANLPAFCFLLSSRGYALVGVNGVGSNAFFVRRHLLNDIVHEVSLNSCIHQAAFRDSRSESGELTFLSGTARAKSMLEMPLIDVSTGQPLCVGDLLD